MYGNEAGIKPGWDTLVEYECSNHSGNHAKKLTRVQFPPYADISSISPSSEKSSWLGNND